MHRRGVGRRELEPVRRMEEESLQDFSGKGVPVHTPDTSGFIDRTRFTWTGSRQSSAWHRWRRFEISADLFPASGATEPSGGDVRGSGGVRTPRSRRGVQPDCKGQGSGPHRVGKARGDQPESRGVGIASGCLGMQSA